MGIMDTISFKSFERDLIMKHKIVVAGESPSSLIPENFPPLYSKVWKM
jgi:hypothetical protein